MKILMTLLLLCLRHSIQLDLSPVEQSIMNDLSWGLKMQILKDFPPASSDRRVGIELLTQGHPGEVIVPAGRPGFDEDDEQIKVKLFRMMHETLSDSDAKIKRAELIRKSYENNTSFEVGYIVGDATDKYNTMLDISGMLTRLSSEWKPLEHINAYEHIANKGIEINQLIELVKAVTKKNKLPDSRRRLLNISL